MNRQDFGQALKRHDWAFEYSECFHTRRRGRDGLRALKGALQALEPPFTLRQLEAWAGEAVVTLFNPPPDEDGAAGRWQRKGSSHWGGTRDRSELITESLNDEIERWIND